MPSLLLLLLLSFWKFLLLLSLQFQLSFLLLLFFLPQLLILLDLDQQAFEFVLGAHRFVGLVSGPNLQRLLDDRYRLRLAEAK